MEKVTKSDQEWRKILTDDEYRVLREGGTERAFSGEYNEFSEKGTYLCSGCQNELFSSDVKFKSGSGWPSFYAPISEGKVKEVHDDSHGMSRTEVLCNRCDGHLGHVFSDGPQPTGLRYCINSVSLDFKKNE